MKNSFLLLVWIVVSITSCNTDDVQIGTNESPIITKMNDGDSTSPTNKDPNYFLKSEFSRALAKVFSESKEVRELIKKEALKKIDYDYDVLYEFVKHISLKDGNTLESLLLTHLDREVLSSISEKIPTLTIFVPTLPENTFSAALWDIEKDIPEVAFRSSYSNDITSYNADGIEDLIEANLIPGYPIVVIKENERIVANDSPVRSKGISLLAQEGSEKAFSFLSEVFDNTEGVIKEVK